ncbi:hypothetical protein Vadar_021708 [Vaccinium darrowii]|uniref:Uncharacterized protein n=1 Tax=Vaccinium darrowii TaxID=229202 RepID=A0ACB7Y1C5_9ERIC|nr:hypothetical protein Vadar_021708 [Vaccinium darrowii]
MADDGDHGSRGMGGETGDNQPPSDDIGWKFAKQLGDKRHKMRCLFCNKLMNGGITRLKQHLAHQKGQVTSCPNVSAEVRMLMMQHLLDGKDKLLDKRKRKEELIEQIRESQRDEEDEYAGLNIDSDDSDPELTRAQQESLRMRNEHEERQIYMSKTGVRYHEGGSSGAGGGRVEIGRPLGFPRRCSSIRETGARKKWTDHTSPRAQLADIDIDLHRSKGLKQPKLASRLIKGAKKKLGRAVSQFLIYSRLPTNTVNSPWLEPMLDVAREVGKGTKLPSAYEVDEVYLPKKFESLQTWVGSLKPAWEERGVSIMCDGWECVAHVKCYECGEYGHYSYDCTAKDADGEVGEHANVAVEKVDAMVLQAEVIEGEVKGNVL